MDRNGFGAKLVHSFLVALRKESVDRNMICLPCGTVSRVALRKESVDRNYVRQHTDRRRENVALRKESVDRNRKLLNPGRTRKMSLSARRAWIEITAS